MGRFFSAIHVKNNKKDREQLLQAFSAAMKKRGLAECTEDEASITYLLAFSEQDKWVTLTAPDYESDGKKVSDDTRELAKELKTSCLSISVVDSDFALIELYGETTDTVIVGDGSGYGFEEQPRGKKECWAHLLSGNTVWEQLSEIWSKEYVFAEDLLCETAPLLGIDAKNMVSDYEDFSGETDSDANVIALYFKNAEKKSMSLNTAFKKVFGEALEPLGFKKIKGKQPYFVRVVPGGEIIHIITYTNEWSGYPWEKKFNILGGIATVYRQKITLDLSPKDNLNWLETNSFLYVKSNPLGYNEEFANSIFEFSYKDNDTISMLDSLTRSLNTTLKVMIPILNKVKDYNACIEYFKAFNLPIFLYDEDEHFGNTNPNNFYNEGLLYLKIGDNDKIITKMEERLCVISDNVKMGRFYTQKDYDKKFKKVQRLKLQKTFIPELYIETIEELERRKTANTEILRSYGLDL